MTATQTTQTAIPLAYRLLAERILEDAVEYGVRFGDRKVFLSTIPSIDLTDSDCCAELQELRRTGALVFARADLVAAMDPALVEASTWTTGSRLVPGFATVAHFVVLPDHLVG